MRPWRETDGRFINVVARVKNGHRSRRPHAPTWSNRKPSGLDIRLQQEQHRQARTVARSADRSSRSVAPRSLHRGWRAARDRVLQHREPARLRGRPLAGRKSRFAHRSALSAVRLSASCCREHDARARWRHARHRARAVEPRCARRLCASQLCSARRPELTIDARVLLYVAGLSMLTGLVAGLAPSVIVARRPIVKSLHASSSRVTHSPRIRQLLVVGQVAMTVVLSLRSGPTGANGDRPHERNHGFEQQGLLTMQVALPGTRYPIERQVAFQRDSLDDDS